MKSDLFNWYIFGYIAAISGIINGIITYMITHYLSKHDIKINYWNLRLLMLKYLNKYRKLTIEENGKPGRLYYAWIVTLSLFLIFAVILVIYIISTK